MCAAIAARIIYVRGTFFTAAALVLAAIAMPTPAPAAIITTSDMARGFAATHEQCMSLPRTVWVGAGRYRFCIQYYLSTAGGESLWPSVFLQGDRRSGKFDARTGRFAADPRARDVDTASLERFADLLSRRTRSTAIYLARIGVDGSSGHQDMRRSTLEGMVLNLALTAIKQRHGFKGFHLVGQSGGAANIGALLALRSDIGCAVPGSGPLALRGGVARTVMDPLLVKYNGLSGIAAIVRNRPARVLVVTDPLDRTVAPESQSAFVRALEKAGVAAEQYFVTATDDNHHGVTPFAAMALAGCIDGKSRDDISGDLARLGARMIAAKKAAGGRAPNAVPTPATLIPGPAASTDRAMPLPSR
jgi:hypothetical protein